MASRQPRVRGAVAVTDDVWSTVRDRLAARADRIVADLEAEWGQSRRVEPFDLPHRHHDPAEPPTTVDEQLDRLAGLATVIVFYTDACEKTVLVYNRAGGWEPPGGVIEPDQTPAEAARTEAHEESGLTVELTELVYTGRVDYRYPGGERAPLPVVAFAGHRTGGRLRVERETNDHPGVTRAVGLFDAETLPETRRDGTAIRRRLGGKSPDG
jgi:8-oxo-dGTP pyrophosphatase MutT (NUDIX family)